MAGPTEEALGLTSPETDFLARVWTLFEADSTFDAKVKTTNKLDGSPHDLDEPSLAQMPYVGVFPTGSSEGWVSNVQHRALLNWTVYVAVRGWDKVNWYGLVHHIRDLLTDRDNFDALHTGTSVVHETQAAIPNVVQAGSDKVYLEGNLQVQTYLRIST